VARARQLLDFLVRAAPGRDRAYTSLLQEQAELLRQHSDAYLFHEHLEQHNEPIWFLDFCERLSGQRLRYLAEAEFGMMLPSLAFPPEIEQQLEELAPSLLEREQYMDFVRNRSFRQSLVCHDRCRPSYQLRAHRVTRLWVASPVQAATGSGDLSDESPVEFQSPDGLRLESSIPLVKSALACLGEAWPASVRFDALAAQSRERCRSSSLDAHPGHAGANGDDEQREMLAAALLSTFARSHGGLLRLSLQSSQLAAGVSAQPVASPLARYQALQGAPITSLRHEMVPITPFDRHLLPLLDGTRDTDAMLDGLMARFREGLLNVARDDQPVSDPACARGILAEVLAQRLPFLARHALLVA
jgi:methyltransferase-like protein